MQRRALWLLTLILVALAPTARGADPILVKIEQFGLEGAYTNNTGPTWVQVTLRNTTEHTLNLELRVAELSLDAAAAPISGTCLTFLSLAAGEESTVNVPVNVIPRQRQEHFVIYAEASDANGLAVGRTGRIVEDKTDGELIALLCATPQVCQAIRQSILLVGSPEEQSRKSQYLRLIQLSQPPVVGWAYASAKTVVVATPASALSRDQRDALELYMIRGGTLVVVEDQLADSNAAARFLGTRRSRIPEGKVFPVAAGKLLRVSSISGKDFSDYFRPMGFSANTPAETQQLVARFSPVVNNYDSTGEVLWLTKRLATSFRFPTFRALLFWIAAYLILVGLVNFIILRRMRHPEWGWVTIPGLAVVFSVVLYLVSVRTHPSNFGLDELAVYQMDALSPLATSLAKVRVSAPVRSTVRLVLPGDVLYSEPQNRFSLEAMGIRLDSNLASVNEFQIGQSWEMQFALRRWSFRDLNFSSQRRFPGTVFRDSIGRLHNETGVNFQQAILVDQRDVFLLREFPSGAVVDLSHVSRLDYSSQTGRVVSRPSLGYPNPPFPFHDLHQVLALPEEDGKRFELEYDGLSGQPFSLVELIRGWPKDGAATFDKTKAVFFGSSGELPLGGTLSGRSPDVKSSSLIVVTFGEWP